MAGKSRGSKEKWGLSNDGSRASFRSNRNVLIDFRQLYNHMKNVKPRTVNSKFMAPVVSKLYLNISSLSLLYLSVPKVKNGFQRNYSKLQLESIICPFIALSIYLSFYLSFICIHLC